MMNLVVLSILLVPMTSAQSSQTSSASPPGGTATPEADALPPLLERLFPRHASAGSWGQGLQPEVLALRCQKENQTVPNWLDPTCRSYLACSGSRLIVELCLPESAYSYSHHSCLPVNQTNCTAQREEFSARVRAFLAPFLRQSRHLPHFFAAAVGNGSVGNNGANNGVYNPDFHAANHGANNGANNGVYNPDFHAANHGANNGANNGVYNPDFHAANNGAGNADFHTAYDGADGGGASDADFLATNSAGFNADTHAALTAGVNAFYSADRHDAPQLQVVEEEEEEEEVDGMLTQLNALSSVFVDMSNSLNVTLDSVTCQRLNDRLPELETSVNIALLMLADCPDDPCDITLFRLRC